MPYLLCQICASKYLKLCFNEVKIEEVVNFYFNNNFNSKNWFYKSL